jgi:hypothetical protein
VGLAEEVRDLLAKNQELLSENGELASRVTGLALENAELASRNGELTTRLEVLELELEKLRREMGRSSGNSGKPPVVGHCRSAGGTANRTPVAGGAPSPDAGEGEEVHSGEG